MYLDFPPNATGPFNNGVGGRMKRDRSLPADKSDQRKQTPVIDREEFQVDLSLPKSPAVIEGVRALQALGIKDLIDLARSKKPLAFESLAADTAVPEKSNSAFRMLEDERVITRGGIRYAPLFLAAPAAQVARSTLAEWIKQKRKFAGQLIRVYTSPYTGLLYVSESSVRKIASRFVKWPSQDPAKGVILGETDAQIGYLSLPEAMRILGVSKRTMYLWATRGKAPSDAPLDVIQCTASEHFYIREIDVLALRRLVPRGGLRPGRRSLIAPEP